MKMQGCHPERSEGPRGIRWIASSAFSLLAMTIILAISAQAAEPTPAMLENVGIEPRLGNTIPLDLILINEEEKIIPLKAYFKGEKPVILALVYYECPNLCNYLLNGTLEGLKKLAWTVGKEFQVVAVSIDPNETPELAAKKKESHLKEYGREASVEGWHFLTGQEKDIRALADAVGFRYAYDESIKQYAHAAGLFILTPQGTLARFLGGIQFSPRDLRLGLIEAGEGKIGTVVDRLLLLCYRYDPKANKYALFATNLMKGGGAVTVLALGYLILRMGRKKK